MPSGTQVDIVLEDGLGNTYTIVSVDPQWTQLERWGVDSVADLDADGVQDVIVFHFTGGAHCCSEYLVFSERPGGIQQDDYFSLGNGGIVGVEDLDGDGIPELDAWDDRLAYFPDLSYAASPSLPLVLCRTGEGTYTDCTILFPDRMQAAADAFEAQLSDAVQRQAGDEEKRSPALGLVTAYLLLAPTDEGWNKVGSLCPECKDWLMQNQDELENRLAYVPPAPPMSPLLSKPMGAASLPPARADQPRLVAQASGAPTCAGRPACSPAARPGPGCGSPPSRRRRPGRKPAG